jgi:twin BRCT domain
MFQTLDASRKRRVVDQSSVSSLRRQRERNGPLSGCVICLSGLVAEEKSRLHSMVEHLGGTYDRNLDTSITTHLIAPAPEGAKYETAVSCPRIRIVTPQWLTESFQARARLDESQYSGMARGSLGREPPLDRQLDDVLEAGNRNKLFYPCQFLLIGFERDTRQQLLLEKLIQRGRGTIYWELNEIITHIIVMDGCDHVLIDAVETVSSIHPMGPSIASPRWIVESWKACKLLSAHGYRPRKFVTKEKPAVDIKANSMASLGGKKRTSSLFRGTLFSLVRLAPPIEAVDFDANELSEQIISNGGQMLSPKVVEALRVDRRRKDAARRTCYVIFWGGFTKTHMSIHALLSQVQNEDLCTLVLVTPIWLQTCIVDGKLPTLGPRKSLLFQPQPWPLRLLHKEIKLAVTGFVGGERTALIQLIRAVGASYTENMKPSNSHLICREAKGPKYEKAIEWKLHVVSVEWLYHVVRYGYCGERGTDKTGCENEFSLRPDLKTILQNVDVQESQEVSETQLM